MIKNFNYDNFLQKIQESEREENIFYGEVATPLRFVNLILSIIPEEKYKNPNLKWLDPGCGSGNFAIVLYFKLLDKLQNIISDIEERKNHIIKNMIFMIEIQTKN